jgi:hypothetical protein
VEEILQNTPHLQQKKPGSWLKIVLIVVAALVVLGVGFAACGGNPGPNSNKSFLLSVKILRLDAKTGEQLTNINETLTVNRDGSVHGSMDDGQPHSFSDQFSDGTPYSGMMVFTGSGTYKDGNLSYTETITSMHITIGNNGCDLISPAVYEHLEGTFSSSNSISGNYNSDSCALLTRDGTTLQLDAETGTWTGTIVTPGSSA